MVALQSDIEFRLCRYCSLLEERFPWTYPVSEVELINPLT